MKCPVCKAAPGQGECEECRALAEEMRANAEAMAALRGEELPPLVVRISRQAPVYSWPVYSWMAAAAAAAVLLALSLPHPRQNVQTTPQAAPQVAVAPKDPGPAARPVRSEALTIKMLTPDPDIVIYFLIDGEEK